MGYMFIRGFWAVWIVGAVVLMLKSLSHIIFSDDANRVRVALTGVAIAFIWPLAFFDVKGRAKLQSIMSSSKEEQ